MRLNQKGKGIFALGLLFASAPLLWALGFELVETKEQLKLKYTMEVYDCGTGRSTITFTLADAGRITPITSVDWHIPGLDKTGYSDLSLTLAPREAEGKKTYTVHGLNEWIGRGEIHLISSTMDGKRGNREWFYHRVKVRDYLKKKDQVSPAP